MKYYLLLGLNFAFIFRLTSVIAQNDVIVFPNRKLFKWLINLSYLMAFKAIIPLQIEVWAKISVFTSVFLARFLKSDLKNRVKYLFGVFLSFVFIKGIYIETGFLYKNYEIKFELIRKFKHGLVIKFHRNSFSRIF